MKRNIRKCVHGVLALAAGSFFSTVASANAQASGRISELWVNDSSGSNIAWIRLATPFSSSCGSNNGYMVLDLSDPAMKSAYALALAAFMAERNVTVGGSGVCYNTYETLKFVYMSQ